MCIVENVNTVAFTWFLSSFSLCCWIVPTTAAIIVTILRKSKNMKSAKSFWLNLLLFGGALFGVVDHIWNKEFFLIGENFLQDISLGIVITLVIFVVWGVMVIVSKKGVLTTE